MKNKFIKPEIELLPFLCETLAPDSYNQVETLGEGIKFNNNLPGGGGDLGVPD